MKTNVCKAGAWCLLFAGLGTLPLLAEYPKFPPTATQPVGEKPHVLKPADWEGTWIGGAYSDAFALTVTVTDATKGRLQVSRIESNERKLELQTGPAEVREAGGWLFINLGGLDDRKQLWFWGRIKFQADLVLLWAPEADQLKELSRLGKLKCRLSESGDLLEPLSPEDLKVLTSDESVVPFEWKSPLILRRVARETR